MVQLGFMFGSSSLANAEISTIDFHSTMGKGFRNVHSQKREGASHPLTSALIVTFVELEDVIAAAPMMGRVDSLSL